MLYWISCFETDNARTRMSRAELGFSQTCSTRFIRLGVTTDWRDRVSDVVSSRRTITLGAEISTAWTKLLHRNAKRFRGGLVFKAHRLCVSLNSRLETNKEEEERVRV